MLAMSLAAAVLATAAPGRSEPAVGMGVGTYTCAEFTRVTHADASRAVLYFSWAQGWMTAWNLSQMDQSKPWRDLRGLTIDGYETSVRAYCAKNPDKTFLYAVWDLYGSLPTAAK